MESDNIDIYASSFHSTRRSIPYHYNYFNLFCTSDIKQVKQNIWNNFYGEKFEKTQYQLKLNHDSKCTQLCIKQYSEEQKMFLYMLIDNHYKIFLNIDDIPGVVKIQNDNFSILNGYDIGFREDINKSHNLQPGLHYIATHLNFVVKTFRDPVLGYDTISEFFVEPFYPPRKNICSHDSNTAIENSTSLIFTYSVKFEKSQISPSNLWSSFIKDHYIYRFNSRLIFIFFFGFIIFDIIGLIFIFQQSHKYRSSTSTKINPFSFVKGEVFRNPPFVKLHSTLIGIGFHLFIIFVFIFPFYLFRLVHPSQTGELLSFFIKFYIITSPICGYLTTNLFIERQKLTDHWHKTAIFCSLFENLFFFSVIALINLVSDLLHSACALPTFKFVFIFVWFLGSSILNLLGSLYSIIRRKNSQTISYKKFLNKIPQKIARKPFYLINEVLINICGFIIFSSFAFFLNQVIPNIFTPISFFKITYSLFLHFLLMILTSITVSILGTMTSLMAKDGKWVWLSSRFGWQSGVYTFLGIFWYFTTQMAKSDFSGTIAFIMYSFLFSLIISLINGSVGFLSIQYVIHFMYFKI